jgi:hypothetical protein
MHGEQAVRGCCERCTGADGSAVAAAVARRRLLKAAVFPPHASLTRQPASPTEASKDPAPADASKRPTPPHPAPPHPAEASKHPAARQHGRGRPSGGFADAGHLPRAVSGTVIDVSPQVLVLGDASDEQRFTLTPDAMAWRGAQVDPAALRRGDHAVVRLHPSSRQTADRIWANIGRVTGIIIERSGSRIVVDEGATRQPRVIAIQPRAAGRIQVRFPTLQPGYLIDIIGLRRDGELDGMIPATSQPAYPARKLPAPPLVSGHVPDAINGSATWHEPGDEPPGVLGVCYPALDPETGCSEATMSGHSHGYARMPYLAIGSVLRVTNECTNLDCMLPVTGCAPMARLFNDRCVTCGTSPRGRIADLTMASFVALGGELDRGCFNATIRIGE